MCRLEEIQRLRRWHLDLLSVLRLCFAVEFEQQTNVWWLWRLCCGSRAYGAEGFVPKICVHSFMCSACHYAGHIIFTSPCMLPLWVSEQVVWLTRKVNWCFHLRLHWTGDQSGISFKDEIKGARFACFVHFVITAGVRLRRQTSGRSIDRRLIRFSG